MAPVGAITRLTVLSTSKWRVASREVFTAVAFSASAGGTPPASGGWLLSAPGIPWAVSEPPLRWRSLTVSLRTTVLSGS